MVRQPAVHVDHKGLLKNDSFKSECSIRVVDCFIFKTTFEPFEYSNSSQLLFHCLYAWEQNTIANVVLQLLGASGNTSALQEPPPVLQNG